MKKEQEQFDKDFPSLKGQHIGNILGDRVFTELKLEKTCLDKQRVIDFVAMMERSYPRPKEKRITDHNFCVRYVIDKLEKELGLD